jgi:hypothetical protein
MYIKQKFKIQGQQIVPQARTIKYLKYVIIWWAVVQGMPFSRTANKTLIGKYEPIERLDQGHLYPLGEHPGDKHYKFAGDRTRVACVTGGHSNQRAI